MKFILSLIMTSFSMAAFSFDDCDAVRVRKTYEHISTIGAMYGQYGIPTSSADRDVALYRAEKRAKKACEETHALTNCQLIKSLIIDDNWLTMGIPSVTAEAIYRGCR